MGFWIRTLLFVSALIGLGAYVMLNQDEISTMLGEPVSEQTESDASAQDQAQQSNSKGVEKPLSKNAAAEGLSRFYANLHGDDDDDGVKIIDNIAYLPEPKGDLEKILIGRAMVTRPLRKNWRGLKESRPFRVGYTIYQKLAEYAADEGLEVIWRLNKDFVIKDPFRINNEILQTAYQIGTALTGHFPEGINVYFCYNQRAIVFFEGISEYMQEECNLLSSKVPQEDRRREQ